MNDPMNFQSLMNHGAALYDEGKMELALVAFQQARALEPLDTNAAAACATLLSQLNQPLSAYQVLATVRGSLWNDADGVANLAIAAESCGLADEALTAYQRALELDPDHVRTLNNLALWACRSGQWDDAVAKAARCVELMPSEPMLWMNLSDFLNGAHREVDALAQLKMATSMFPDLLELKIRHMVSLAFNAEFEQASQVFASLGPDASQILDAYLSGATTALPQHFQKKALTTPDAYDFFAMRAFEALKVCNWQSNDRITALLSKMLVEVKPNEAVRDWRDATFYALMLPLTEEEQTQIRVVTGKTIRTIENRQSKLGPFKARPRADGRMHIGIATQDLSDPLYAKGLAAQLALHDHSRFAFYLYSPTNIKHLGASQQFANAKTIDIAHLTDEEAVGRIRLDRLDLWMDTTFYTQLCRPELPALRVAPVQIRHQTWQRVQRDNPCDYGIGDAFTHPLSDDYAKFGPIARFPHTCWLSTTPCETTTQNLTREMAGLPATAFVLCHFGPALMIDPDTFACWMQMLRALPDAVLWLPHFAPMAQMNLRREALGAGVNPERLIFAKPMPRADLLTRLSLADLFLDTLRFNSNEGLVDALRQGLPAISCAGNNMASRLGGSILGAGGLADCVQTTPAAYAEAVIELGQNPHAIKTLRQRVQANICSAPLFDTAARAREWEYAWTHMVERQRSGMAPEAFDIPEAASLST